jgi:hypothetical protein
MNGKLQRPQAIEYAQAETVDQALPQQFFVCRFFSELVMEFDLGSTDSTAKAVHAL